MQTFVGSEPASHDPWLAIGKLKLVKIRSMSRGWNVNGEGASYGFRFVAGDAKHQFSSFGEVGHLPRGAYDVSMWSLGRAV